MSTNADQPPPMDGQDSDDTKKSTADMTVFVQTLLVQMQNRFQTMSESIITKNILDKYYIKCTSDKLILGLVFPLWHITMKSVLSPWSLVSI